MWLHKWLRKIRAYFFLLEEEKYNIHRQLMFSSTFSNSKSSCLATLMVMTHVLEKGITMPERRLGFGQPRVRDILNYSNDIIKQWGSDSIEVQTTLADLKQYLEVHYKEGYKLPTDIVTRIEQLLPLLTIKDDNCYQTTKEDFFKSTSDFLEFAYSRHSIRWFSEEPVENDKLLAAIKLAQTAPSACNRQATRIKIVASEEGRRLCCSMQNGSRGFGEKADKWILLTTEMGAWSHEHYNSGILDAGIFLMNLLYSFHHYGIAACPLNAHLTIKDKELLQKTLKYPESETPVAFIVVGNPVDSFMVPKSRRVSTEDIIQWV